MKKEENKEKEVKHESVSEMTLRDYFAGQALPSMIKVFEDNMPELSDKVAMLAYDIADAMIKARKSS